ncbi:unnamed protein product, partial [Discosporangium mesarthrocarpum]
EQPAERVANALEFREDAAADEFSSDDICHITNGDEFGGYEPIYAALFHKTLPHNDFGEVKPSDYETLIACLETADFPTCESIPAGLGRPLVNPLGGRAIQMAGADSNALIIRPPPTLGSPKLAAQLAEMYWMALCRDVPFSRYANSKCTIMASENLVTMPGYRDFDILFRNDGTVDPARHLFRADYIGVDKGPHVSQFLVNDFSFDSLTVSVRQQTTVEHVDYMTDYDTWLFIQASEGLKNGGVDDVPEETDTVKRYIRNARDLANLAATDAFYGEAFRAMHILTRLGAISGKTGLYSDASRQIGFTTFGNSHLFHLIGKMETSQRNSWYQKWNVHRLLRPETMGGLVHHTLMGTRDYPVHPSLLDNDTLMNKIARHNKKQNKKKGCSEGKTYLLPMTVREGSPAHPSYPAGHSVSNGAYATILKAFVGFEKGEECFKNPVVPDDYGTQLEPYTVNGLTYEGEINKMAVNVAFGRGAPRVFEVITSMMGVHYRSDNTEGMHLGEAAVIRMLQQELKGLAEASATDRDGNPVAIWKFRLFRGVMIAILPDGSYIVGDEPACHKPYVEGPC